MLLSLITFFPLVVAGLMLVVPKPWLRSVALAGALLELAFSLMVLPRFDVTTPAVQMVERHTWIAEFGISYFLGIDGISIWLVLLTALFQPIVVLGSWTSIQEKLRGFFVCLFVLQTAMLGTFLSLDAVLFYVFWEVSLVPMYFIIGLWGGARRIYATVKFFIFTMAGSVLMLAAIIYMIYLTGVQLEGHSASVLDFYKLKIPFIVGQMSPQALCFFAFAFAFAIKVPMFPVHTWLPDAHVEAPTPGSVLLASLMLKMGTYGLLRFAIPLFPQATAEWAWLFLFLGVVGVIYGALVAMVQTDIKKLVAYSSVSHMGYVILGLFALNSQGVTGGLYQMLNHGISTGGLFLLVGMIYERTHSREISQYGGLAKAMPLFAIGFFIVTFSSIAVPMTNGFVGEFLILLGTFAVNKYVAALAVSGVVLGATYMLWMAKRVFFGAPGPVVAAGHGGHELHDLSLREMAVLCPLIIFIFWMGIYPKFFLQYTESSVQHLVHNQTHYSLSVATAKEPAESPNMVVKGGP